MPTNLSSKATLEEIRERFDRDVERFSNLDTGQSATIDAPLAMELITQSAVRVTPRIRRVLDVGCGAGNNTLKLRQALGSNFAVDLLDISEPMLKRGRERVAAAGAGAIRLIHADLRTAELETEGYDVVLAAAVLHHLRDDADWEQTFRKIFRIVAPGGSVWITDFVSHELPEIQRLMWDRYGEYLVSLGGTDYRNKVFDYVEREDSPRPVTYQLDLLARVGFRHVELLHKNSCFAAFGAVK